MLRLDVITLSNHLSSLPLSIPYFRPSPHLSGFPFRSRSFLLISCSSLSSYDFFLSFLFTNSRPSPCQDLLPSLTPNLNFSSSRSPSSSLSVVHASFHFILSLSLNFLRSYSSFLSLLLSHLFSLSHSLYLL